MINGFINLYKPSGITSNKALGILKYALKENNIITKVGHLGTLDPIAEGVLPIALGRATRLFDYTLEKIKRYTATFKFGVCTDTLDIEGKVTATSDKLPTKEEIEIAIPSLVGSIDQMPPQFSAKVVNGVRAYKLARQGVEVELQPKKIIIYGIKLLEQIDEASFIFEIECSGGTYIRSIVRDLAVKLDTYGIMSALIRTKSGYFEIANSTGLDGLKENITVKIIPMEAILDSMPCVTVPKYLEKLLLNGIPLRIDNLPQSNFKVYFEDNLIGIASKDDENNLKINTWLL